MQGRRIASKAVAMVLLLALACGEPGSPAQGDALASGGGFYAELDGVPLGQEWVNMQATIHNTTQDPIRILDLSIDGPGVGQVVMISEGELGPVSDEPGEGTPTGIYRVYPPTLGIQGRCLVQPVVGIGDGGYMLEPDAVARAIFLVTATDTGRFSWRGVDVSYERDGEAFRELIDQGERGTVVVTGKDVPPPTRDELRCAGEIDARVLNSGDAEA